MHTTTESYIKAQETSTKLGDVVRRDSASTSFDYWFSELKTNDPFDNQVEPDLDEHSSAGHSESDRHSQGSRTSAAMSLTSMAGEGARRRPIRKLLMT